MAGKINENVIEHACENNSIEWGWGVSDNMTKNCVNKKASEKSEAFLFVG